MHKNVYEISRIMIYNDCTEKIYHGGEWRRKEERSEREEKIRNKKSLKVDTISFIPPGRNKKMFLNKFKT